MGLTKGHPRQAENMAPARLCIAGRHAVPGRG